MARSAAAKRSVAAAPSHASRRRAGWVRKNVMMDQRKLDVARRALGVDTETEAIDQALDLVAFREELRTTRPDNRAARDQARGAILDLRHAHDGAPLQGVESFR